MTRTTEAKAEGFHVRATSRNLCTVPKVTAILDIAGFPLSPPEWADPDIRIERGVAGVFITPAHPAVWNASDRKLAINALFRMGLQVDVLPLRNHARSGLGGAVVLWVRPGGSL